MFENVTSKPEDPIDVIARAFKADSNPDKVDLGVGVYRNEAGISPVMKAVVEAEKRVVARGNSKEYLTPAGNLRYCELMEPVIFGMDHGRRIESLQTPGGGPALRAAADLVKRLSPDGRIWIPAPTWHHQTMVFEHASLEILEYPYYDRQLNVHLFNEMMAALEDALEGDVVLLHGCCHNPTGADLSDEQWQQLAALLERRKLIPFIDLAYQGFGRGLDEDAYGVKLLTRSIPEVIVASSSSKSFSIYRERAGMISLVSDLSQEKSSWLRKEILEVTRGLYFMSADHGAAIVVEILESPELTAIWRNELDQIRDRINSMRQQFADGIAKQSGTDQYSYISHQYGMFSLLPLDTGKLHELETEFSIYLIPGGRLNFAGLSEKSMDYVVNGICTIAGRAS
jgi:aspartate aminotransferase